VELLAVAVQLALWRLLEWVGDRSGARGRPRRVADDRLTRFPPGEPARRTRGVNPLRLLRGGRSGTRRGPGRRARPSEPGDAGDAGCGSARARPTSRCAESTTLRARSWCADVERALNAVQGCSGRRSMPSPAASSWRSIPRVPRPRTCSAPSRAWRRRTRSTRSVSPTSARAPWRHRAGATAGDRHRADVVALSGGVFGQLLRGDAHPRRAGLAHGAGGERAPGPALPPSQHLGQLSQISGSVSRVPSYSRCRRDRSP